MEQFWNFLQKKLAYKESYVASIEAMKLRLPELKENDSKTREQRNKDLPEGYKDVEGIL